MGTLSDLDKETLNEMATFPEKIGRSIENYRFREALSELMNLARLGNKYLTETEPWKLFKTDVSRTATVLNIALQICANLAIMSEPFLPFSAGKLQRMLNMQLEGGSLPNEKASNAPVWQKAGGSLLAEGLQLAPAELLFEKIKKILGEPT